MLRNNLSNWNWEILIILATIKLEMLSQNWIWLVLGQDHRILTNRITASTSNLVFVLIGQFRNQTEANSWVWHHQQHLISLFLFFGFIYFSILKWTRQWKHSFLWSSSSSPWRHNIPTAFSKNLSLTNVYFLLRPLDLRKKSCLICVWLQLKEIYFKKLRNSARKELQEIQNQDITTSRHFCSDPNLKRP